MSEPLQLLLFTLIALIVTVILAAVFLNRKSAEPMLPAGMREMQDREVTLSDCHPETLEAVLQFCYMGECRRPKKDMLALLVMADRLDIPCLTALCEKVRAGFLLAPSCCL